MRLILLGPVGSGKGTQAGLISEKYGIPHISTGDIFRMNIKNETPLGKTAKSYVDQGLLVPDELTCDLVKDRITKPDCANGFVLDGFPRNKFQAEELNKLITIDLALMIDLSEAKIIERLSIRRMCTACGQPTTLDWMVDGKCEKCGADVYIRDDDKPEVIKTRIQKQAVPLDVIEYYSKKGVFSKIDATDYPQDTFALVKEILDTKINKQ